MGIGVQLLPPRTPAPAERGSTGAVDTAQRSPASGSFASALKGAREAASDAASEKRDGLPKDGVVSAHEHETEKPPRENDVEASHPEVDPEINNLLGSVMVQAAAQALTQQPAVPSTQAEGPAEPVVETVQAVGLTGGPRKAGSPVAASGLENSTATLTATSKQDPATAVAEGEEDGGALPVGVSGGAETDAVSEGTAIPVDADQTGPAGAPAGRAVPLGQGTNSRDGDASEDGPRHSGDAGVRAVTEHGTDIRPGDAVTASAASRTDAASGKRETEPSPPDLTAIATGDSTDSRTPAVPGAQPAGSAHTVAGADNPAAADGGQPGVAGGIAEQIADRVRQLEYPRDSHVRLHLRPESLGALDLHLRMRDGVLTLDISAHTDHGRSQLESALPQLRAALSERGIDVGRVAVNQGDPTMGSGFSAEDGQRRGWEMDGWAAAGNDHSRRGTAQGSTGAADPYGGRTTPEPRNSSTPDHLVDLWV